MRAALRFASSSRRLAMLKVIAGDTEQLRLALENLDEGWQRFLQRDGMPEYTTTEYGYFLLDQAQLAQLNGATDLASELHREAITLFDTILLYQEDNTKAIQYRSLSEQNLVKQYERKFGSLESVPLLNEEIENEKLLQLTLSPQQGFVLSRVNGLNSMAEIATITGMEKLDILKMFNFFINHFLRILS